MKFVGTSYTKIDAEALSKGNPLFTDDIKVDDMLYAKILWSPLPHAIIKEIDTSEAEKLDGVRCVLTHKNTPQVRFTTAGQGYPEPSPYDTSVFNRKVRYVGDRVAVVAADSPQIAERALSLIKVEYEELPAVFDPEEALTGKVIIHDEPDATGIDDPKHNLITHIDATVGNIEKAFEDADIVVENSFKTQYSQHTPIEPHITIAYIDEYDRLVIRTSTQVPFHIRRMLSIITGLPESRIRVIKPRIGGGFGVKQELMLEDIAALITLKTKRPVRIELNRREEFISSRTRHPMKIEIKIGAKKDGRFTAIQMKALSNTGAYGAHAKTVLFNVGSKTLPLYNKVDAVRFIGDVVYTNLPVAGAYRGYGATQGYTALESTVDIVAERLKLDPIEIRKINHIRENESSPIFEVLGEGKKGTPQIVKGCKLQWCIEKGAEAINWNEKHGKHNGRGVGMAILMQGSGIALIDMGAATIRMNDDGTFMLLIGATDIGTGSDTILAQIAAEELGISPERIYVYSSDTDTTPFDVGAYASSTTYISGNAVRQAANDLKDIILKEAGALMKIPKESLKIQDNRIVSDDGSKSMTLNELGKIITYTKNQKQIEASASFVGSESPPPFAAHFVEVEVDKDTGFIKVLKYVAAIDCGTPINPELVKGQTIGAIANGIGYALFEECRFNKRGKMTNADLLSYNIMSAADMPEIEVFIADNYEPTGPFGAKSIAEININGPVPAIANAVRDAVGISLHESPFTPERVLRALKGIEK